MHKTTRLMAKPLLIPALLLTLLLVGVALAGCHAPLSDDEIVLAFTHKDTETNPDKDPQRLADWIEQQTGIPTRIHTIESESAAIEALNFGHAHAAFMDGGAAWISWQMFDFEAIAADQKGDGRTYYNAQAWVKSDSGITDFADFEGRTSCHTGLLKSAGMFMPLGYLIKNGHVEVVGDPDEVDSIEATVRAHFDDPSIPMDDADPFSGYDGALRCLSEDRGDIALVRDTTWEDYCEGDDVPDWCLPRDAFDTLEPFGKVPSHPVMVGPETSQEIRAELVSALLALNDSDEGRSILTDVLETPGITEVGTEEHLGDYSELLGHVPGVEARYKDQLDIEE